MLQREIQQLSTILKSGTTKDKLVELQRCLPTKDPQIAECIMPCISNETDPIVKRAMIQSIGITGKPEQLKKLLKLTEDDDPKIRMSMAKAIIKMEHSSFFPFIVRFLNDEDHEIKSYCGQKLTKLGIDNLVELLESMWKIDLPWTKLSAIKAARQFKHLNYFLFLKKDYHQKMKNLHKKPIKASTD